MRASNRTRPSGVSRRFRRRRRSLFGFSKVFFSLPSRSRPNKVPVCPGLVNRTSATALFRHAIRRLRFSRVCFIFFFRLCRGTKRFQTQNAKGRDQIFRSYSHDTTGQGSFASDVPPVYPSYKNNNNNNNHSVVRSFHASVRETLFFVRQLECRHRSLLICPSSPCPRRNALQFPRIGRFLLS